MAKRGVAHLLFLLVAPARAVLAGDPPPAPEGYSWKKLDSR